MNAPMIRAAGIVALAAVCASAHGAAQQPPTGLPGFRSSVDVVEVDVIVQDTHGAFVSDLGLDDFELLEEGKPQKVQQLYLHRLDDPRKPSSRPSPAEGPRTFVVVFDEGHLSPSGFKRTQEMASKLFADYLLDGDLGGIVVDGKMANDHLTRDRSELLKGVRDAKPTFAASARQFNEREWPGMSETDAIRIAVNGDSMLLQEMVRRACADQPDQCRTEGSDPEGEVQAKALQIAGDIRTASAQTLQVLTTLMDGLGQIEGRKAVLLMSEGFMAGDDWPGMQEAQERAARANARIYTLEAQAVDRSGARPSGGRLDGENGVGQLLQETNASSDLVNSLALETGGFAVRTTTAFATALAQIASDGGNYYVLGYRPASLDGRYHKLSVKVKRQGVAVRARAGYVAAPAVNASILGPISSRPIEPPVAGSSGNVETPAAESAAADTVAGTLQARPGAASHVAALAKDAPPNVAATQGWDAYARGDFESARSSLSLAAVAASARPWVQYALGHAQYALGDYAKATAAWERVITTVPEFEPVYFDLADGYVHTDEYDRAVRLLRRAVDRWPRDGEVFRTLGVVQALGGTLDEAVGSLEKAIELAPADAAAYFNLGKALELRYYGSRRYDDTLRAWVANEEDRSKAAARYERCIALGGPFADNAREGLVRLEWTTK